MQIQETISLEQKIGQLIIIGFHGTSVEDSPVQKTLKQIENGDIGGVGIYRYNIEDNTQLSELIKAFKNIESLYIESQ